MKTIIVYSGKGGVGKTTTTINIARMLASKGKSVYILDADVNTPSIHSIIKTPNELENITAQSTGYMFQGMIYLKDSLIRQYIGNCIKEIRKLNPDYVLVDTPPSITDVHISLMSKLNVSAVIAVTQPTSVSMEDVKRTVEFFIAYDITLIGVVQNMISKSIGTVVDTEKEIHIQTIAKVPLRKTYNDANVLTSSLKPYEGIYNHFENLEHVVQEVQRKQLIFDDTTEEQLEAGYNLRGKGHYRGDSPRFYNVQTWDWVCEKYEDINWGGDKFFMECTTERIARLLKAFEEDSEVYMRISKSPATVVKLITGEVGKCTLVLDNKSYYGVPRVKYSTFQGDVTLFPYEVMPVSTEEIQSDIKGGFIMTKDGRYLPSKEITEEIYNAYGDRVGLYDNWEEIYDSIIKG